MSRRPQLRILGLAGLALAFVVGAVAGLEVPYLSDRIVDEAGLIDSPTRERIESDLEALEEETGAQVAVLTVESLEGDSLEEFSLRVAETWGLGRAGEDDGVLLLVARGDRKMRLEVGYGLEGRITDLQSGRILDGILRPAFRRGDFSGGIEEGVAAVATLIRGGAVDLPDTSGQTLVEGTSLQRLVAFLVFVLPVGVFALIALFSSGCGSWFLYLFLMPFLGLFPATLLHPAAGWLAFGAWLLGFPLFKLWMGRTTAGKAFTAKYSALSTFANSGWALSGGGSGGGGFSGGFSGGGGSFGGGGASSSW